MNKKILGFTLACTLLPLKALAIEWNISYGLHDLMVEQAGSHTLGGNIGVFFIHQTEADILFTGNVEVFVDNDKDKLDPDHIPVWFKSYFLLTKQLHVLSKQSALNWFVELDEKRNTVSGVEQQVRIFPGLDLQYKANNFDIKTKLAGGYYFLEIDDDAPSENGYSRDYLQNKTFALLAGATININAAQDLTLGATVQQWHDGDQWLENQFKGNVTYHTNKWIDKSTITLSVEHTKYNLTPFDNMSAENPSYQPVLNWDNDTLFRLYMTIPIGG